jgi:hypothetical protein
VASTACYALRLHAVAAPPRVGLTQALGGEMNESLLEEVSEHAFSRLEEFGGDIERLPLHARALVIVYSAQGIIDNGGLEYFFESNFPSEPPYSFFTDAYHQIGAFDAAHCIDSAVAIFPFTDPHLHQQPRRDFLAGLNSSDTFTQISDQICGNSSVWTCLSQYAERYRADIIAA